MLNLGPADHALIARARLGFARDFRYLEAILWEARQRLAKPRAAPLVEKSVLAAMVEKQPSERDLSHLGDLEPRLLSYTLEDPSGCWTWHGTLTGSGQPVLRLGPERRVQPVRRWVFEATHGAIPDGRRALAGDGCRPRCVHPDHTLVLPEGVQNRRKIKA